jgi:hypothetical protein
MADDVYILSDNDQRLGCGLREAALLELDRASAERAGIKMSIDENRLVRQV